MTTLTANEAPPPNYYASNLREVIGHLDKHQLDVLGPQAADDLRRIASLDEQPLRLLARLITRTTEIVRCNALNYAEVDNTEQCLVTLTDAGLIESCPPIAADALLARLRVAEIRQLFPRREQRCKTKQALVSMVLHHYGDAQIQAIVAQQIQWVGLCIGDSLQRMLIAYFGSARKDFSDFVIRDLGLVQFEDYGLDANCRVFDSAADMQSYLDLLVLQRLPARQRAAALPWLLRLIRQTRAPGDPNPDLRRRQDRLLIEWGRDFERETDFAAALTCYAAAHAHPARERQVRILSKLAKTKPPAATPQGIGLSHLPADPATAARDLLERMHGEPVSLNEKLFADKQLSLISKANANSKLSALNDLPTPWRETLWRVTHAPYPNVEQRVLGELVGNGGSGWHVENALFTSLLGLAFWDCIFAPIAGMFSHAFQSGPRDLYWPDFRHRRSERIANRLRLLAKPGALWREIHATHATKFGLSCSLVSWPFMHPNVLAAVQQSMSSEQLLGVFDFMLTDLRQTRTGLPDLFVCYAPGAFELVEVKGPGDQLQPNQRVWLNQLSELGIPCRVIMLRAGGA